MFKSGECQEIVQIFSEFACFLWTVSSIIWILFTVLYMPVSKQGSNEQITLLLTLLYFYDFAKEWTCLNLIVACANFTPHGYQNVCSLGFQFMSRLASSGGTIFGPYLMQEYSFLTLSHYNAIAMIAAFLLLCWAKKIRVKQIVDTGNLS